MQIGVGTFLGGPIAAIYFLKMNFDALKEEELSKITLQVGAAIILAIIGIIIFFNSPENDQGINPTMIISLYTLFSIIISIQYQMKKDEITKSAKYNFQSNWKVIGIGIVGNIFSFLAVFIPLFLLQSVGIINIV